MTIIIYIYDDDDVDCNDYGDDDVIDDDDGDADDTDHSYLEPRSRVQSREFYFSLSPTFAA